jgi:hypothetical protein
MRLNDYSIAVLAREALKHAAERLDRWNLCASGRHRAKSCMTFEQTRGRTMVVARNN